MKVNQNVLRFFLGYLGGELNQACVGNGNGAESESFDFNNLSNLNIYWSESHRKKLTNLQAHVLRNYFFMLNIDWVRVSFYRWF